MTLGLNSPSEVRNAAFHLSLGFIRMLLYPHLTSNFVNKVHPLKRSMVAGMSRETFQFFIIHLFSGL